MLDDKFIWSFDVEWAAIVKEVRKVFHEEDVEVNDALLYLVRSVDSMFLAARKRSKAGYEENRLDYAKRLKELNSYLVDLDSQISKESRGEK